MRIPFRQMFRFVFFIWNSFQMLYFICMYQFWYELSLSICIRIHIQINECLYKKNTLSKNYINITIISSESKMQITYKSQTREKLDQKNRSTIDMESLKQIKQFVE